MTGQSSVPLSRFLQVINNLPILPPQVLRGHASRTVSNFFIICAAAGNLNPMPKDFLWSTSQEPPCANVFNVTLSVWSTAILSSDLMACFCYLDKTAIKHGINVDYPRRVQRRTTVCPSRVGMCGVPRTRIFSLERIRPCVGEQSRQRLFLSLIDRIRLTADTGRPGYIYIYSYQHGISYQKTLHFQQHQCQLL